MRLSILLGTAAILLAAPAFAADIGAAPEPLPTPSVDEVSSPPGNWTGFYLGAIGGYAFGTADTDTAGDIDVDGFDIGGYAGANWQWGNFVIGAEGDLLYPFRDGSGGGITVDQGLNGSLRARLGYSLDRFLVYGTGGAAGTELELSSAAGSDEQTLWGWTAGAGLEGMVLDNVTARIEYRYTDYEDKTFTLGGVPTNSDFSDHAIRGGVGVKF
jgi:outer membrane immunogenic protein